MTERGIPVVLSGPSGCGKGTIVAGLLDRYPSLFELSVSATTRAPRPGETDGVQYHFVTPERFRSMIENGEILEYTQYCGNYYGTPCAELETRSARGIHTILEIEVEGAMNIRRLRPDAILIFVMPPDRRTLEERLRGRKTNTEEEIGRRLRRADEEIRLARDYDYIIINRDGAAEEAAEEIAEILRCEGRRSARREAICRAWSGTDGEQ